jgi:hypothetical protein
MVPLGVLGGRYNDARACSIDNRQTTIEERQSAIGSRLSMADVRFGTESPCMIAKWLTARTACLAALALFWINLLTTGRWAAVPGALNGPKRPFVIGLLVITTILALRWRGAGPDRDRVLEGRLTLVAGFASLAVGLIVWFPPSTWTEMPYLDNWATRYRATMDALALWRDGAVAAWNWDFLGGYQTSSDITQHLAALAALPVAAFGPAIGFHVLHAGLFVAIPWLVFADVRLDGNRGYAAAAAGLTAFTALCFSYLLLRSGDTNSLAGLFATCLALVGAHAAAARRRWGGPLLVGAMALVSWSHTGFLIYAIGFLGLDAAYHRDGRRAARAAVAAIAGVVAGLPLTWESWRYPAYFLPNNVLLDPAAPFDLGRVARDVYYNVEMLVQPGRWLNDITGLASVCLPLVIFLAWTEARARTRAGWYAVCTIAVIVLMKFNVPEFGYLFLRPVHLLAVFVPPALAWFLVAHVPGRLLRLSFVALVAVYVQVWWQPVPHIANAAQVEPALVERMRGLDGALVLVENTPHRDMDASPDRTSERTPFAVHFESLLPALTGRRLYGGMWDGWQWTPARDQVLAGGAFKGRALDATPVAEVVAELRRWGVRHLLVWSGASRRYFGAQPAFAPRGDVGRFSQFELIDADTRSVVTATGTGTLEDRTPLRARIRLDGVTAGSLVTVRTNFHPSWTAWDGDRPVPLEASNGQLAFGAPRGGTYDVTLAYPRRPLLIWIALAAILAGMAISLKL